MYTEVAFVYMCVVVRPISCVAASRNADPMPFLGSSNGPLEYGRRREMQKKYSVLLPRQSVIRDKTLMLRIMTRRPIVTMMSSVKLNQPMTNDYCLRAYEHASCSTDCREIHYSMIQPSLFDTREAGVEVTGYQSRSSRALTVSVLFAEPAHQRSRHLSHLL